MRPWFLKKLLRWYRRRLERLIDFGRWDPKLSAKIDAISVLLDD
jgi:hypothetical protein